MHTVIRLALAITIGVLCTYFYKIFSAIVQWIFYILLLPVTITLTLQLSGLKVALLMMFLVICGYLILRYYVFGRYSQLRAMPSRSSMEILPEPAVEEPTPADLLSKIKIFGYLEPEVYAELVRSVQERTIEAGEVLKAEGSFCLLIEGSFKLSIRKPTISSLFAEDREEDSTELILSKVRKGGVLTSLLDILSVLTNDEFDNMMEGERRLRVKKVALTKSKLLIIPEEIFRALPQKHPKATAHIIQIIMSRFNRVTFMTLQRYLGLSKEALEVVKSFNQSVRPLDLDIHELFTSSSSPLSFSKSNSNSNSNPTCKDINNNLGDLISNMSRKDREFLQLAVLEHVYHFLRISGSTNQETLESISLQVATSQTKLLTQGERNPGLYILLYGEISIYCTSQGVKREICMTRPGSIVGAVASIFGHYSLVGVMAKSECLVAVVSKRLLETMAEKHPDVMMTISRRLLHGINPLIKVIDTALEWNHLDAGQTLCYEGDRAEHIHIVLHGRLRSIQEINNKLIGEYGAGESLGEIEMLLESNWTGTVRAVRDTEVASMPKHIFDCLAQFHPEISLNISRILARKTISIEQGGDVKLTAKPFNLQSVAIVPIFPSMQSLACDFAQRLYEELSSLESTLLLDKTSVGEVLGKQAFKAIGKLKLLEWLHFIEEEYRIVLYVADSVQSPWTQRCIRQADCILFIAHASSDPTVGAYERLVFGSMAQKELVLIHNNITCPSGLGRKWLDNRIWISDHHHIYMPSNSDGNRMTLARMDKMSMWQRVLEQAGKYGLGDLAYMPNIKRQPSLTSVMASAATDDIARLARRLLGKSIGIVLGGGGARGLSHIGVIQALVEAGIPIDCIGGTSIGAFMGALYARDVDHYMAQAFAKQLAQRMSSKWRQILDLTYPITSWLTGHAFNRTLWKIFGEKFIEDLWIPFFAVTTDIAHSKMMIHRAGYVWRYVRASMSLSGFLPPLCDHGALLVDGGYLDNVPVDVMLEQMKVATVIAIDVGAAEETDIYDYGDTLSGFWLIFQKLIGRKLKIPTLAEIQSRLAYISCTERLSKIKLIANTDNNNSNTGIMYLRPPVEGYEVMDFHKHQELFKVGYQYGRNAVEGWRKDGTLKKLLGFGKNNSFNSPTGETLVPSLTIDEAIFMKSPELETIEMATPAVVETTVRQRRGRRRSM